MGEDIVWTSEQNAAIQTLISWIGGSGSGMMSLTGYAGTGKSTLMKALRGHFGGRVAWSALTGKAALRLSEVAGVNALTLHKTIYEPPKAFGKYLNFDRIKKPDVDYLVVDESSMVAPQIFDDLRTWVGQGVRILFVGDGYQLPPVLSPKEIDRYGHDFIVFREVTGPVLTKVMRSGDGIVDAATEIREKCRLPEHGNDSVSIQYLSHPGRQAIMDYMQDRDDHVLITWTNKLRMAANEEIRRRLGHVNVLPDEGEPVLMCRNGQGVLNGEVVVAHSFRDGPRLGEVETHWMKTMSGDEILVSTEGKLQPMDGTLPDIKDWKDYKFFQKKSNLPDPVPITYGYVFTCHKIQGSEARRVSVFLAQSDLRSSNFNQDTKLPDGNTVPFGARFIYTAATRAKSRLSLLIGT